MSLRRIKTPAAQKTVDFKEGVEIPGVTPSMVNVMQKLDSMDMQMRSESKIEALTRDLEALKQSNEELGKQLREQLAAKSESSSSSSSSRVREEVHAKLNTLEAHTKTQSLKREVNDRLTMLESNAGLLGDSDEEEREPSSHDQWTRERGRIHQMLFQLKLRR